MTHEFDPETMVHVTAEQHAILERHGAPVEDSLVQPDGSFWVLCSAPIVGILTAMRLMRPEPRPTLAEMLVTMSEKASGDGGPFHNKPTKAEKELQAAEAVRRFLAEVPTPTEVYIGCMTTVEETQSHEKKNLGLYITGTRLGLLETVAAMLEGYNETYEKNQAVQSACALLKDLLKSEGSTDMKSLTKISGPEAFAKSRPTSSKLH